MNTSDNIDVIVFDKVLTGAEIANMYKGGPTAVISGTALKTIETPVMGDEEMCKHLQDCYDKTPHTSAKSADKVYEVRVHETVGLSRFVPNVK